MPGPTGAKYWRFAPSNQLGDDGMNLVYSDVWVGSLQLKPTPLARPRSTTQRRISHF